MRIGRRPVIGVGKSCRLHRFSGLGGISLFAEQNAPDLSLRVQHLWLLHVIRKHLDICHGDHGSVHAVLYVLGGLPYPGLRKRNVVGVLGHAPVDISLGGYIPVKLVQNVPSVIIGIVFQIPVPLLVNGEIYPCAAADALDRRVEYPERLCVFLHIRPNVRMGHIVPLFSGIDLIGNDPV